MVCRVAMSCRCVLDIYHRRFVTRSYVDQPALSQAISATSLSAVAEASGSVPDAAVPDAAVLSPSAASLSLSVSVPVADSSPAAGPSLVRTSTEVTPEAADGEHVLGEQRLV